MKLIKIDRKGVITDNSGCDVGFCPSPAGWQTCNHFGIESKKLSWIADLNVYGLWSETIQLFSNDYAKVNTKADNFTNIIYNLLDITGTAIVGVEVETSENGFIL